MTTFPIPCGGSLRLPDAWPAGPVTPLALLLATIVLGVAMAASALVLGSVGPDRSGMLPSAPAQVAPLPRDAHR